jgi:hypothetical protein
MARNTQPLHICFDRVIPDEYNPARAASAQALRQATESTAGDLSADGAIAVASLALPNLKMWPNGSDLKCRFLDGSTQQRKMVQKKAEMWHEYANITFTFGRSNAAEIRISFSADPGSWSAVGTDALVDRYFPRYQPTMNFGWLRDDTSEECERVVLHEFGHALGCIHEHQNPNSPLQWKTAEVYRAFSGPPNYWTKEQIDHNILRKYSPRGMSATRYDDASIMLYQFPAALFTNNTATALNTHLSDTDKQMIARMYPKPS